MLRVRDPTKPPCRIARNLDERPTAETQRLVLAYLESRESIGEKQTIPISDRVLTPSTPGDKAGQTPKGTQSQPDSDSNPVNKFYILPYILAYLQVKQVL